MSKYCASSNYNNVKVVVRTRPTLKFARSLISLENDHKVNVEIEIAYTRTGLRLQQFFFDCVYATLLCNFARGA